MILLPRFDTDHEMHQDKEPAPVIGPSLVMFLGNVAALAEAKQGCEV